MWLVTLSLHTLMVVHILRILILQKSKCLSYLLSGFLILQFLSVRTIHYIRSYYYIVPKVNILFLQAKKSQEEKYAWVHLKVDDQ